MCRQDSSCRNMQNLINLNRTGAMSLIVRLVTLFCLLGVVIRPVAAEAKCFSVTSNVFCVYANKISDSEVMFRFEFPKSLGWVALGAGSSMSSADVMMITPTPDGKTVSITSRTATRHGVPALNPSQDDFRIQANATGLLTINNEEKYVATFIRSTTPGQNSAPAITAATQPFIWAGYAGQPPANANTIPRHTARGVTNINVMDNSMAFIGASTTDTSKADSDAAASTNTAAMIQAHGVILFIAWLIMVPGAILVARFYKAQLGVWWFRFHWAALLLAAVLTYIGFGLAFRVVQVKGAGHIDVNTSGAHVAIGLLVLIITPLQMILGVVIDRLWSPTRTYIPWHDRLHWWLGRIVGILGIVNLPLGMALYNKLYGEDLSAGLKAWPFVVFAIVLVGTVAIGAWLQLRRGQTHHPVEMNPPPPEVRSYDKLDAVPEVPNKEAHA
ncbi:hypothetical protein DFS34DRAFT_428219 [Phlyctochytrium arcticum]|nr:hypothetical protein DFS34DRAFT_428219 [Phlyctochytrium arcticum]